MAINSLRLAVDKKLHDKKFQRELKKDRSPQEQALHTEMKKFLQIMDVDEYEQFLKGSSSFLFRRLTVTDLAQQKELENRVRELQDFRAAGLTKLEQIEQFSEEKKHNRVSQTLLSVAYVHRNRGQDPTLPRSVLRLLHRPLFRTVPNANSRLFHLHLQPSRTPVLLQM